MKRIQNNPILITLAIFLSLLLLGIITSSFVVRDRLDHVVYGTKITQLEREYEGYVTLENNNLGTITVHMKNPALENKGNISFQLFEDEILLREVNFSGNNVGDPGDVKLKFDMISDSAGKTYKVKLIASDINPSISVNVDKENNLGASFYFRKTTSISEIHNVISNNFNRIINDKIFVFLWGLSIAVVATLYFTKGN